MNDYSDLNLGLADSVSEDKKLEEKENESENPGKVSGEEPKELERKIILLKKE